MLDKIQSKMSRGCSICIHHLQVDKTLIFLSSVLWMLWCLGGYFPITCALRTLASVYHIHAALDCT